MLLYHSIALGLSALSFCSAQTEQAASGNLPSNLVGTWSTKSNKTLTGPGFYNPIADEFIEPERTGISYSFTADGHFEEAYYRAISNPVNPACPSAIMQWQHGKWQMLSNGSLTLTPIPVDGRQLLSEPCKYKNSIYTRYNQSELYQRYSVYTDPYHGIPRLDMFKFDGSPMHPMYLVYSPPQMLPTTTLNPTATSGAGAAATKNAKRGLENTIPLNWKPFAQNDKQQDIVYSINAERVWWVGLAFTGIGGLLYFGPRRLGIRI